MVEPKQINKGFKQTGIGLIPEDWEVKSIEEIADVKSGKRLPLGKALTENRTSHPYIRVADMRMGGVNLDNIQFVPDDVFPSIKNYRIFVDDVFISVAGTLGIVGAIPKILDGANLTENADKLTNIKCDKDYILYILMSFLIQNRISIEKTLGAQPKLALTRIKNFELPIPKLSEQKAIAEALSDTDALIAELEKLIAKKRAIKQGTMQELLKPKVGWETKELGKTATLKARIGWQGLTTAEYRNSGDYYLITGTEFKNGFVDWESCFFVDVKRYNQDKNIQIKRNDVLVTKDGTIGKVALIRSLYKPATLNSGVFVIRPINNSFDPVFFYYIMQSDTFISFLSQLKAGSTINHLYQKDFVSFQFRTPKAIEEQSRIAGILSDMDAEIEALESKLEKYKQIKQGMMQNLLTGKIRLCLKSAN